MPDRSALNDFAAIVGDRHALTDPADIAPHVTELRDIYHGETPMVLLPGSVDEVAAIARLAARTGTALVPQGGNTGLVGGQIPDTSRTEIIVSLKRLNRIRNIDAAGNTMTLDAGVVLSAAQEAAAGVDRLFPLSLGSEGTCQIGGNIATNAGGTGVLAYGNTRDLVLGLEAVMADGRVLDLLKGLRKDNTGYDLKQLLIGSEGTLGIITGAVVRLFPRPRGIETAFAAVADPKAALVLFERAQAEVDRALTAFELMPRIGLEFVTRHLAGTRDPLSDPAPWYALLEVSSHRGPEDARSMLESVLGAAIEDGIVTDAAISQSLDQAAALWKLRTGMSDVQRAEGGSIKHDVSVPVDAVPAFIERASRAVEAMVPGCRPVPFGHLGDGNIHFNISQPLDMEKSAFLALWDDVNACVHGIVAEMGGSVSAEHGIGRLKRSLLGEVKSPVALDLMRAIKGALDPQNILNPGVLIPDKPPTTH